MNSACSRALCAHTGMLRDFWIHRQGCQSSEWQPLPLFCVGARKGFRYNSPCHSVWLHPWSRQMAHLGSNSAWETGIWFTPLQLCLSWTRSLFIIGWFLAELPQLSLALPHIPNEPLGLKLAQPAMTSILLLHKESILWGLWFLQVMPTSSTDLILQPLLVRPTGRSYLEPKAWQLTHCTFFSSAQEFFKQVP